MICGKRRSRPAAVLRRLQVFTEHDPPRVVASGIAKTVVRSRVPQAWRGQSSNQSAFQSERAFMMIGVEPWANPDWVNRARVLIRSFRRRIGRELLATSGSDLVAAEELFRAPFIVVAHGAEPDPLLNYANALGLRLWEMDPDTLARTPSRLTAEPVHRDERARLLERTFKNGYVDDYAGIRISRTGKRFAIERAIIWNLNDDSGRYCGQAATFDTWTPLGRAP